MSSSKQVTEADILAKLNLLTFPPCPRTDALTGTELERVLDEASWESHKSFEHERLKKSETESYWRPGLGFVAYHVLRQQLHTLPPDPPKRIFEPGEVETKQGKELSSFLHKKFTDMLWDRSALKKSSLFHERSRELVDEARLTLWLMHFVDLSNRLITDLTSIQMMSDDDTPDEVECADSAERHSFSMREAAQMICYLTTSATRWGTAYSYEGLPLLPVKMQRMQVPAWIVTNRSSRESPLETPLQDLRSTFNRFMSLLAGSSAMSDEEEASANRTLIVTASKLLDETAKIEQSVRHWSRRLARGSVDESQSSEGKGKNKAERSVAGAWNPMRRRRGLDRLGRPEETTPPPPPPPTTTSTSTMIPIYTVSYRAATSGDTTQPDAAEAVETGTADLDIAASPSSDDEPEDDESPEEGDEAEEQSDGDGDEIEESASQGYDSDYD